MDDPKEAVYYYRIEIRALKISHALEIKALKQTILHLGDRVRRLRSECRAWRRGEADNVRKARAISDQYNDVTARRIHD